MKGGSFWGALVLKLRLERGLSQRQLAETAQVPRNTLRNVESGVSGQIDILERLLAGLGYELEAIALIPDADKNPGTKTRSRS